jgi:sugar phosphate isomerase/epimerase
MKTQTITRREFLKTTATTTAALAAASPSALFAAEGYGGNKIPFGVQLYSVRKECAKDLPGTLAALAKMGYKGVEFADYFGRDAKTLRKMLDDLGLKCCGTHIYLETMLGDELPKTIEFNEALGNRLLIVRMLRQNYTGSRQGFEQAADLCSEVAEKLKPHGMRIGYHNHETEFRPLDTELPWDIFFNRAKKDVVIQLDTANAASGGADPVVFLRKFPGRVPSIHAKGFSKAKPGAIIGDDELNWKEIFHLCETTAGTEWYIVEYESDLYPPLVAVEKTLEVMRRWGKC